ncbi:UNVERIFIED_CONTAM: hypothetical protein K2H54_040955 [Gekko kuhli]
MIEKSWIERNFITDAQEVIELKNIYVERTSSEQVFPLGMFTPPPRQPPICDSQCKQRGVSTAKYQYTIAIILALHQASSIFMGAQVMLLPKHEGADEPFLG